MFVAAYTQNTYVLVCFKVSKEPLFVETHVVRLNALVSIDFYKWYVGLRIFVTVSCICQKKFEIIVLKLFNISGFSLWHNVSIFQGIPFARHGSCPLFGQASIHVSICSSALSLQSNIELHKESWFKHLFWFGHFQRPELLQISTK